MLNPVFIDYMKNFDIPVNKEYQDHMDKMHKELHKLLCVPMHILTPIGTIQVVYPITNRSWSEYSGDVGNITGPKFPTSPNIFNRISDYMDDNIEVFSAQLRQVRNSLDGHVLDPWERSLYTYSKKYKIDGGMSKHEMKLVANGIDYLLIWIIETSLNKEKKVLLIWEEVFVTHVTKRKQNTFFDSFDPRRVDTSNIYKLES